MACLACCASPRPLSTAPDRDAKPESPELPAEVTTGSAVWPPKAELFLLANARATLELRSAASGFSYPLAENAQIVLYDPALELVWVSDGQTLSVIDLRNPAPHTVAPLVIATGLPPHVEIQVQRGQHQVMPMDACDVAPIVVLHWTSAPWIEADHGQPLTGLAGSSWLAREIQRPVRQSGEQRWFHPSAAHVALPLERARCEDARWCGASLDYGATGLRLVLTEQSEGSDCRQFGCLLFDPTSGGFATPPQSPRWGSAPDMPSGSCGPYRFDSGGRVFLVDDLLCAVGGECEALGGVGIGWLAPGLVVGAPG